MKILWITYRYTQYKNGVVKGTGGWVGALKQQLIEAVPDLELGIALLHETDDKPLHDGRVTYFPIYENAGRNAFEKLFNHHFRNDKQYQSVIIQKLCKIVNDYNPDVVHVWGLENFTSGVVEFIKTIPVVVHIQGFASAIVYSHTPYDFSPRDVRKSDSWFERTILRCGNWYGYKALQRRAENELRLAPYVKNWIGRTEWDKTMVEFLSPGSRYFHCEEILRDDFDGYRWQYHFNGKIIQLQSTLSEVWYKGFDIVLKTAKVLMERGVKICWHIYGCDFNSRLLHIIIQRLGVTPENVGVICHGYVDGSTLRDNLLRCDAYIHTSYMENSSNAIAEAQLLGVPVIAQNVGGNASMLKDNSGILISPNEPYILAAKILSLRDRTTAIGYSERALYVAKNRHDKNKVISNLMAIYNAISNNNAL